jgi:integration host factor subunit alpha
MAAFPQYEIRSMTITKTHLTNSIHSRLHLPKTKSARLVDSLLEIIKGTLEGGEDVLISGFGKFSVRDNNRRNGRKPPTYGAVDPGARRVVRFRCSPALSNRMNGKR